MAAYVSRGLVSLCLLGAVALAQPAFAQKKGGTAVIGQEAGPPTLDMHFTTNIAARNVVMQIYEQLITRDESNAPMLELAAACRPAWQRARRAWRSASPPSPASGTGRSTR